MRMTKRPGGKTACLGRDWAGFPSASDLSEGSVNGWDRAIAPNLSLVLPLLAQWALQSESRGVMLTPPSWTTTGFNLSSYLTINLTVLVAHSQRGVVRFRPVPPQTYYLSPSLLMIPPIF